MASLLAGCSAQGMAQSATATPAPASPTASAPPTEAAPATTAADAVTGTTTPEGTPTVRPTPTGTPPAIFDVMNIFNFFPSSQTLVKRDSLQLDDDPYPEVLFTVAEAGETITDETFSALRTLDYDPVYREWKVLWLSDVITGTASPLPAYDANDPNRVDAHNAQDLLRSGAPIFLARTTAIDGSAHLFMWKWDAAKKTADLLKMADPSGAERTVDFQADLDVKVADLDDDGVYEVVGDNLSGVEIWKWDGSRYVMEGGR
jgi:hypothetical protein